MRELKFRAWDRVKRKMLYGVSPFSVHITDENEPLLSLEYSKHDDCEFEQYTGLKDKNGKEIYEGDIVDQFVCGVHQFKGESCGRRTIWQVRWNEEECCFELHYLYGSLFGDSMMSKGEEYVVVGNIHENPELLEEE